MASKLDPAALLRLVYILGGLFLTVLSWVWVVASRAKSCAGAAQTEAAKNAAVIDVIRDDLKRLHADQKSGFEGVHARLDKFANGK